MIKEFRVRWTAPDPKSKKNHAFRAWSRIIGQKFVACNGDFSLQKSELFPYFDKDGSVLGTQIFTGYGEDSHIIEIPNLK